MHCKFFYGHNSQCIKNDCVKEISTELAFSTMLWNGMVYTIKSEEAAVVREIFDMKIAGIGREWETKEYLLLQMLWKGNV